MASHRTSVSTASRASTLPHVIRYRTVTSYNIIELLILSEEGKGEPSTSSSGSTPNADNCEVG